MLGLLIPCVNAPDPLTDLHGAIDELKAEVAALCDEMGIFNPFSVTDLHAALADLRADADALYVEVILGE